MSGFDVEKARAQFPALNREIDGQRPVFFDGPGGTQVPQRVLDAMVGYLGAYNSNLFDSPFFAVQKTHEVVREARVAAAAFVNAPRAEDIIFGASMSALTSHMSRSIAAEWQEGDEIIVTALDHYANVSFWQRVAEERGVTCHVVHVKVPDCTLDYEHLERLVSEKTRLVAFTLASNVSGSRVDAQRVIKAAKAVGALTYADSVHAAAHFLPDVQALDCDFLACSAYKFCGPHLGILYGRQEHLKRLRPYKVEPASHEPPECWEMGTKSFEALSGFTAAIHYMVSFNNHSSLRESLKAFYKDIFAYEQGWSRRFLERAGDIEGMRIYGLNDVDQVAARSPTFAFTIEGYHPKAVSDHLAHAGIATGFGNFYAQGLIEALDLAEEGGVVRAGCVHYNTLDELERFFEVLSGCCSA
jgi:cysteine desulfurase family protein (TIGR01976 family)